MQNLDLVEFSDWLTRDLCRPLCEPVLHNTNGASCQRSVSDDSAKTPTEKTGRVRDDRFIDILDETRIRRVSFPSTIGCPFLTICTVGACRYTMMLWSTPNGIIISDQPLLHKSTNAPDFHIIPVELSEKDSRAKTKMFAHTWFTGDRKCGIGLPLCESVMRWTVLTKPHHVQPWN